MIKPQWWIDMFGVKKPKQPKKSSFWNPDYTLMSNGTKQCQHGVNSELHCCDCHAGILLNPELCICYEEYV